MTKNRKRVLNLESLETKRVFSANGLASPVAVESDVVSNGVSEFPDSPLTNDDIRALHSGKPFHLEINKGKLTIRALIGEHHITVSKLRGRRLQITATNMSDPRRAYSEVVSSRGIKDILYFGTYKADSFQNDTNIRSTSFFCS
ncbi:MAG: hypothetical protein KDB27_35910, partial [Planctomycetales bacterium]|nr:hypothetical protein [Planctomycetales bacterium]